MGSTEEGKLAYSYIEEHDVAKQSILDKYEGFVFDMDGVLWEGATLIPKARETVEYLMHAGKKVFFVTNNSSATRKQYIAKLKKLGYPELKPEVIYCAAAAVAKYMEHIGYKGKVFVLGGEGLREELSAVDGLEILPKDYWEASKQFPTPLEMANEEIDFDAKCVVMGFDQYFNYWKLGYATRLLTGNPDCLFIISNKDKLFPCGGGKRLPGTGAFIEALEMATSRRGHIVAKPGPFIIDDICESFSIPRESLCMIGDNLHTDIDFAISNGIGACMVETGVSQRDQIGRDRNPVPHFVLPTVAVLLAPSFESRL